jgi:hypothetical protein
MPAIHPGDRTRDPWALADYSLHTSMASFREAYILNRNLALQLFLIVPGDPLS